MVAAKTSFAVLLKYFQIVDFLMNFFNKVNVELGSELKDQIEFLNAVQFPKIAFLEKWSLTQDGGQDSIDSYLERSNNSNTTYFEGQESQLPNNTLQFSDQGTFLI